MLNNNLISDVNASNSPQKEIKIKQNNNNNNNNTEKLMRLSDI